MKHVFPWVALLIAGTVSAQKLPQIPVPKENPITAKKVLLGKALFWDEQLSSNDAVACGTCHRPASGGADPRFRRHPGPDKNLLTSDDILGSPGVPRLDKNRQPIEDAMFGHRTQVTDRLAPSIFTAQYADLLFWDGRASSEFRDPLTDAILIAKGGALESQAIAPILNSTEMAHAGRSWVDVATKLRNAQPLKLATNLPPDLKRAVRAHRTYGKFFAAAFGDSAITPKRIAFAIASYERKLVPNQTPFDKFIAGDRRAMTRTQRRGFEDFKAARCNECHKEPLFTDNSFRNIGIRPAREDEGRRTQTRRFRDRGSFKVPSLRNVGLRSRFMHNGQFTDLSDVVGHYRQARRGDNADPLLRNGLPIRGRQGTIVEFLKNALTDPRVAAEKPPFDRPTLRSERVKRTK
jgi:cytochrome c peroxidase